MKSKLIEFLIVQHPEFVNQLNQLNSYVLTSEKIFVVYMSLYHKFLNTRSTKKDRIDSKPCVLQCENKELISTSVLIGSVLEHRHPFDKMCHLKFLVVLWHVPKLSNYGSKKVISTLCKIPFCHLSFKPKIFRTSYD